MLHISMKDTEEEDIKLFLFYIYLYIKVLKKIDLIMILRYSYANLNSLQTWLKRSRFVKEECIKLLRKIINMG